MNNISSKILHRFPSRVIHSRVQKASNPWPSSSKGMRTHYGVNVKVDSMQRIYSPIPGQVLKKTFYDVDGLRCGGLLILGRYGWSDVELKIFNIELMASGNIADGEIIGRAQNLYSSLGAKNHIHLEVKKDGINIDPFNIWRILP